MDMSTEYAYRVCPWQAGLNADRPTAETRGPTAPARSHPAARVRLPARHEVRVLLRERLNGMLDGLDEDLLGGLPVPGVAFENRYARRDGQRLGDLFEGVPLG